MPIILDGINFPCGHTRTHKGTSVTNYLMDLTPASASGDSNDDVSSWSSCSANGRGRRSSSKRQASVAKSEATLRESDVQQLNERFEDSFEDDQELRIQRWIRDCTDIYRCCDAQPFQHREREGGRFKPTAPNTPRYRRMLMKAPADR